MNNHISDKTVIGRNVIFRKIVLLNIMYPLATIAISIAIPLLDSVLKSQIIALLGPAVLSVNI